VACCTPHAFKPAPTIIPNPQSTPATGGAGFISCTPLFSGLYPQPSQNPQNTLATGWVEFIPFAIGCPKYPSLHIIYFLFAKTIIMFLKFKF